MKIVFDSEDDSHVHIEVDDVDEKRLPMVLGAVGPECNYINYEIGSVLEVLQEIYPNDDLNTILEDHITIKYITKDNDN